MLQNKHHQFFVKRLTNRGRVVLIFNYRCSEQKLSAGNFCYQPPSNHHPTHGISSHPRRHLVTSGFSEMEATCKARPPKKFWRSKSLGPCRVRVRGCWLLRWSLGFGGQGVDGLEGLEGLAELQNPWIIHTEAPGKDGKTVGSLTYHLKLSLLSKDLQGRRNLPTPCGCMARDDFGHGHPKIQLLHFLAENWWILGALSGPETHPTSNHWVNGGYTSRVHQDEQNHHRHLLGIALDFNRSTTKQRNTTNIPFYPDKLTIQLGVPPGPDLQPTRVPLRGSQSELQSSSHYLGRRHRTDEIFVGMAWW